MWKKYKWIIILLVIIGILVLLNIVVEKANQGGLLIGRSHKDGGIKGYIKGTGKIIEMEHGEAILNQNSMSIRNEYLCKGTPVGIASEINQIGGGRQFSDEGYCQIIN